MSARIAALMSAGAMLAFAQPALADHHLPEVEAETVWMDERDAWSTADAPVNIAYEADLPRAPVGYRWIPASEQRQTTSGAQFGYSLAERDAWLSDCTIMLSERQYDVDDYYRDDADGGLIGGLLGAIVGGVAGNRIADGDRLLGTVIGGGLGTIAGVVIGNAVDRDGDNENYASYEIDPYAAEYCAAYMRRYEAQGLSAIAGHGGYGGHGAVMTPSTYAAPQRTVVRRNCGPCEGEAFEEVLVDEPTAARAIPPRRAPRQAPAPTKLLPVK